LSQSTFDSLVEKFGGTQAQADQLFSLLGGTETGTVSNAQMLHALGNISSDPSSQTSQMLLSLMDTNHNRVVSSSEFTQFETSMVDEERATTVTG
jgi:Ca2+-binding EF-hand superfamily protein